MKTAFDLSQIDPVLFMDAAQLSRVLLAGAARVGVANASTGARQSYHVEVKRQMTDVGGMKPCHRVGPWFVKVHTQEGWAFLGTVVLMDGQYTYKPSPKSAFDVGSAEQRGFVFLMKHLAAHGVDLQDPAVLAQMPAIPAPMKVWREAVCARCGEALFSEYVALGFGPTCAKAVGLALPKRPRKKGSKAQSSGAAVSQDGAAMKQGPVAAQEPNAPSTSDANNVTSLVEAQIRLQAIRAALPAVDWESDARVNAWLDAQMGQGRKILPMRRAPSP
jgi:hypothetical protein